MSKRGTILRDANAGPGLVNVDGQQHQFTLEGVWKSAAPPKPNMAVDVDIAPDGRISSMTAVSESQIAKEQAEVVMAAAREKSKAVAAAAVAKFGLPTLIATGLLLIGWFFLNTAVIQSPVGNLNYSFWQVLGYVNAGGAMQSIMQGVSSPSAGLYGLLSEMEVELTCLGAQSVKRLFQRGAPSPPGERKRCQPMIRQHDQLSSLVATNVLSRQMAVVQNANFVTVGANADRPACQGWWY